VTLRIANRELEVFVAPFLDSQKRLIAAEALFSGTLAQTSVCPRAVVKATLRRNTGAVIFAQSSRAASQSDYPESASARNCGRSSDPSLTPPADIIREKHAVTGT
jgi:hypothetical protein